MNADDVVETGNLFAYCGNNAVNDSDPSGHIAANLVSAIVGALFSALFDIVLQSFSYWGAHNGSFKGLKIRWGSVAIQALAGLASGLLMVSKFKTLVQAIGSGLIAGAANLINLIIYKPKMSVKEILIDLLVDVAVGTLLGAIGRAGMGAKYFKKDIIFGTKLYFQNGVARTSLKMTKSLFQAFAKDFAKSIIWNIAGLIGSMLGKAGLNRAIH